MKARTILHFLLLAAAGLALVSPAPAADSKAAPASDRPGASLPVLEKGMTAETILKYFGKPEEVTPLDSTELKAEKWTYRRELESRIIQTANQQATVQTFGGYSLSGAVTANAIVPDYHLKYVRTYQMTALLLVDGKLVRGKQWLERSEEFADN